VLHKDETNGMEKLISARHYCFVRGVVGQHPDGDFRMAFRDLNPLYVELKRQCERSKPSATQRKAPTSRAA
jgi:hypothetical protein